MAVVRLEFRGRSESGESWSAVFDGSIEEVVSAVKVWRETNIADDLPWETKK